MGIIAYSGQNQSVSGSIACPMAKTPGENDCISM